MDDDHDTDAAADATEARLVQVIATVSGYVDPDSLDANATDEEYAAELLRAGEYDVTHSEVCNK